MNSILALVVLLLLEFVLAKEIETKFNELKCEIVEDCSWIIIEPIFNFQENQEKNNNLFLHGRNPVTFFSFEENYYCKKEIRNPLSSYSRHSKCIFMRTIFTSCKLKFANGNKWNTNSNTLLSTPSGYSSCIEREFSFYSVSKQMSHDLLGQKIFYPDRDATQVGNDCTPGWGFLGEPRLCTLFFIAHYLNATLTFEDGYQKSKNPNRVRQGMLQDVLSDYYAHPGELYWMTNGFISQPFSLLVVFDENRPATISALIGPYDKSTWILCAISLGALVLTVFIFSHGCSVYSFNSEGKTSSIWIILKMFIGPLVEQNPSDLALKNFFQKSRSFSSKFLFGIWLLCCVVLSGSYNGVLFSFLTQPTVPTVPETIEEFLRVNTLPIISNDRLLINHYDEGEVIFRSLMKKLISDYLNNENIQDDEAKVYKALNDKLNFVDSLDGLLVAAFQQRLNVGTRMDNNHSFTIPLDFVHLSFKVKSDHFAHLMTHSQNGFVVKTRYSDHLISMKMAIAVSNTFYSKDFNRMHTRTYEMGIRSIWDQNFWHMGEYFDFSSLDCLSKSKNQQKVFDKNWCFDFFDVESRIGVISSIKVHKENKALSFKNFYSTYLIFAGGLSLSTFIFCFEFHLSTFIVSFEILLCSFVFCFNILLTTLSYCAETSKIIARVFYSSINKEIRFFK